jgi:hypothetical protein
MKNPKCKGRALKTSLFGTIIAAIGCLMGRAESAERHPDLNGVWAQEPHFSADGRPTFLGMVRWAPLSQGAPDVRKPPTPEELDKAAQTLPPPDVNVFQIGIIGGPPLPLTDVGKQADIKIKSEVPSRADENSPALCRPASFTGMGGAAVQIVQTKDATILYGEAHTRIIYTDGRSFDRSVLPQWGGYSIGHWDGGTFVVLTRLFKGDSLGRFPVSDKTQVTEYFNLTPDRKTLTDKILFEDPTYFTEPMGMMVYMNRHKDLDVLEDVCLEGLDSMIKYTTKYSTEAEEAEKSLRTHP